jgi:hypothetical protein
MNIPTIEPTTSGITDTGVDDDEEEDEEDESIHVDPTN